MTTSTEASGRGMAGEERGVRKRVALRAVVERRAERVALARREGD